MTELHKLTDSQKSFAEEHHHLISEYLRLRGLEEDYYDVVILRYLMAVQQYDLRPELRQYPFRTIARNAMRSALGNHFSRQKREYGRVLSLDFAGADGTLHDKLAADTPPVYSDLEAREAWDEMHPHLTAKQLTAVKMRSRGYTNREAGRVFYISPKGVSGRVYRARKRIDSMKEAA